MNAKDVMAAAREYGITTCSNCGQALSEENIIGGLLESGLCVESSLEEIDHISLCCPSYSDETGCQVYGKTDMQLPAYWYSR